MLTVVLSESDLAGLRFAVSPVFQLAATVLRPARGERPADLARGPAVLRTAGPRAAPLRELVGGAGAHLPDFLTPAPLASYSDISTELARAAQAPTWRIATDARVLEPLTSSSDVARRLADGDRAAPRSLARAMRACFDAGFGTSWPRLMAVLRHEVDRRMSDLRRLGPDAVLAALHPALQWRRPELVVRSSACHERHVGDGRGLVLVPLLGRSWNVVAMTSPWEPIVLGYPLGRPDPAADATGSSSGPPAEAAAPVQRLLGSTRARVLAVIAATPELNTTEVAADSGVSVATASEHLSVLRAAGLVTSRRSGGAVVHRCTWLGASLLVGHHLDAPVPRP